MITLAADCLVFRFASGENIPFSAEMLSSELLGESAALFDEEFVRDAAHAVIHYFKRDLGRQAVSVGEFAEALEKVLRGLRLSGPGEANPVAESDLALLARQSGLGGELFFFPLLREEMRRQLQRQPRLLRFHQVRECVKILAASQRWSLRCQQLEDRVVVFLRESLSREAGPQPLSLLID